ncbi:hypothetical protein PG994_003636 [Apiospora phragmitis]|uniref:Uncharacterized protein n=1 Tax=Apiospora phragmitis TaxID=2905665 RepID=A0ABR1VYP8_9PEZI
MWSMIEVHTNIICASLPVLWRWFWNLAWAVWKTITDRDAKANSGSNLATRVMQRSLRRQENRSSLTYYQLQSPEENRMMHEMLFTPIPPLTHTKSAPGGPRGGNRNFDGVEGDGYYNTFAWKLPYQRARRDGVIIHNSR